MIPKTCNLHPTWTTVVVRNKPLLPSVADVNWAVPRWLPVIPELSLCQGTPLLPSTPTQCGPVRNRLSSVGFDPIFTDAQHGCTSEWTADSVNVVPQHETRHGVGWRCKSRILAVQFVWNMLSFFIVLLPRRINWLRLVIYILGESVLAKWSCIFPKPGKLVSSNM